jgi:octanoyl-[GcvH]:protein N-octanoyltransferase
MRPLRVLDDCFPDDPALDAAVSRAVMHRVAEGALPETLRLARPAAVVAFAKRDALAPGYARALAVARGQGFGAILRLAGGRAAVFHEGTLELAHALPDPDPKAGIHERFEATAALIARALRELGVDGRVGEVAGEYCPGRWSVNAAGLRKLAGTGQRIVAGGSHTGAVIVVDGAERVREVLEPVYAALDLEWDPRTVGAVADEVGAERSASGGLPAGELGAERSASGGPPADRPRAARPASRDPLWDALRDALLAQYARRFELVPGELDRETLALARHLASEHRPPAQAA